MKTLKKQNGFTIVELIMVIVLLGILATTAIPYMTSTNFFNLDTATRKLESDLRYAQNLASTTGDSYGFRTLNDGVDSTYEIYEVSTNQAIDSPYSHIAMQEDFEDSFPGILFENGTQYDIEFDSDGNPSFVAGGSTITLIDGSQNTKTIDINTIGLISVQ